MDPGKSGHFCRSTRGYEKKQILSFESMSQRINFSQLGLNLRIPQFYKNCELQVDRDL